MIDRERVWQSFVDEITQVTRHALATLAQSPCEPDEPALNRRLFKLLVRSIYDLGSQLQAPPFADAPNLPSPDHQQAHERETKRPDFQWSILNAQAVDIDRFMLTYVVECKRLGRPPSPSWVLNRNYIGHGVARFVTEEHGYGLDADEGAMVGYVQSSDFEAILSEVNAAAAEAGLPPLELDGGGVGTVHCLRHSLDRAIGRSPFGLVHHWVDLSVA